MPDPARELIRLAMERFGNLWPAEAKMLRAAAEGTVADVADRPGDEKLTRESAWGCWEQWGGHRKIRAEVLRWVLVDDEAAGLVQSCGIVIDGAVVEQMLDLDGTTILHQSHFARCALPMGIVLRQATLPILNLQGSHAGRLLGDRVTITGSLFLRHGCVIKGEVRLVGAKVGSNLECVESTLLAENSGEDDGVCALMADGIVVEGGVFLRSNTIAKGEVRLLGARIGGTLDCRSSIFESNKTSGASRGSISADGVSVSGSVFLGEGTKAMGEVRLLGATIGRDLCINGSELDNSNADTSECGHALSADGAMIGGTLFFTQGTKATGEIRLVAAKIGGDIACCASCIDIRDRLGLSDRFALNADGVEVNGSVYFKEGMHLRGELRLVGARIGGGLECSDCRFEAYSGRSDRPERAISADGIVVVGSVFFRSDATSSASVKCHGAAVLVGARISGDLQMPGMICDGDLDIDRASVEGTLQFDDTTEIKGSFDLSDARVARIHDSKGSWLACTSLNLNGFRYGSFTDECTMSVQDRIAWIERGMKDASGTYSYSPLPYQQLARVYAAMGQTENCVIVRQEQYRKLREHERPCGEWRVFNLQGWLRWAWRVVIDKAIGCGYAPLRPMWFMLTLWIVGCVVFNQSDKAKLFVPASDQVLTSDAYVDKRTLPPDYQPLNAWMYSADTMLPIIDFHQERFWLPGWGRECTVLGVDNPIAGKLLRYYLWFHIAAGWILSTLLAVGLTGLVRSEEEGTNDD